MRLANGNTLASLEEIHMGVVHHFQNFLIKDCDLRDLMLNDLKNMDITVKENEELIKWSSELELKKDLESIPKDSSPSPDGFRFGIFVAC